MSAVCLPWDVIAANYSHKIHKIHKIQGVYVQGGHLGSRGALQEGLWSLIG